MSKRLVLTAIIAIALSVVVSACGGGDDDTPATQVRTSPPPPATAAPAAESAPQATAAPAQAASGGGRSITIINGDVGGPTGKYTFVPSEITASVGETVTFTLTAETEFHTVTVDELGIDESIDGGDSATYTHTFDKAGTFKLVCLVHEASGMVGTITVQ